MMDNPKNGGMEMNFKYIFNISQKLREQCTCKMRGALFFPKNQSSMCAKTLILPLFLNILEIVVDLLAKEWGVWCVIF